MTSQLKQRAPFGRRAWSYALDMVFALVPALILFVVLYPENGSRGMVAGGMVVDGMFVPHGPSLRPMTGSITLFRHLFCAVFVVVGLLETVTCRSLGKIIMGLEIRDQSGRPPEIIILASRAGLKLSPFLCFLLAWFTGITSLDLIGLGLWFLFFTGCFTALSFPRTALHDMVAGTSVYTG